MVFVPRMRLVVVFAVCFLAPLRGIEHPSFRFDAIVQKSVYNDSWEIVMSCADLDGNHALVDKFKAHVPKKLHEDDVVGVFTGAVSDAKASVLSDGSAIVLRNVALFDPVTHDVTVLYGQQASAPDGGNKLTSEAELSKFVREHLAS